MLDSLAMRAIVEDVSQGFRLLWRVPGFAIPIVLLLCLGITAASVSFSVLDALLLRDTTAVPTALRIEADWRVLAFGIAISLLTALLVGLAPAFQGRHSNRAGHVFHDAGNTKTRSLARTPCAALGSCRCAPHRRIAIWA